MGDLRVDLLILDIEHKVCFGFSWAGFLLVWTLLGPMAAAPTDAAVACRDALCQRLALLESTLGFGTKLPLPFSLWWPESSGADLVPEPGTRLTVGIEAQGELLIVLTGVDELVLEVIDQEGVSVSRLGQLHHCSIFIDPLVIGGAAHVHRLLLIVIHVVHRIDLLALHFVRAHQDLGRQLTHGMVNLGVGQVTTSHNQHLLLVLRSKIGLAQLDKGSHVVQGNLPQLVPRDIEPIDVGHGALIALLRHPVQSPFELVVRLKLFTFLPGGDSLEQHLVAKILVLQLSRIDLAYLRPCSPFHQHRKARTQHGPIPFWADSMDETNLVSILLWIVHRRVEGWQ